MLDHPGGCAVVALCPDCGHEMRRCDCRSTLSESWYCSYCDRHLHRHHVTVMEVEMETGEVQFWQWTRRGPS